MKNKNEIKLEDVDDATVAELRLVENMERSDLTEAEKGDAIVQMLIQFPEKYPTIISIG